MIRYLHGMTCCGLREMSGAQDNINPKDKVFRVALEASVEGHSYGAIIYSTNSTGMTRGKELADFIEKNGLGTVDTTEKFINPNTSSDIQVYLWIVNRGKLDQFFKEEEKKRTEEFTKKMDLKVGDWVLHNNVPAVVSPYTLLMKDNYVAIDKRKRDDFGYYNKNECRYNKVSRNTITVLKKSV